MNYFHATAGQVSPGLDALHALCDAQSPVHQVAQPFDTFTFIMAYENGELNEDEIVYGFQQLIDSGLVWSLQGSYGRMAARLIEDGYCS
jgi:hypothetical protein